MKEDDFMFDLESYQNLSIFSDLLKFKNSFDSKNGYQ